MTAAVLSHAEVIADELNVKKVAATGNEEDLVHLSAKANFSKLGPELGPRMQEVATAIAALGPADLETILGGGSVEVAGRDMGLGRCLHRAHRPRRGGRGDRARLRGALDTMITDELRPKEWRGRSSAGCSACAGRPASRSRDRINLPWASEDPVMKTAMDTQSRTIAAEILAASISQSAEDRVRSSMSTGEPPRSGRPGRTALATLVPSLVVAGDARNELLGIALGHM